MSWLVGATLQNLCKANFVQRSAAQFTFQRFLTVSSVDLAARKGTREKARKKKVKVEVKKFEFIPKKQRLLMKRARLCGDKHLIGQYKPDAPEDLKVYSLKLFQKKIYSVSEAIKLLGEACHPTMMNNPSAPVILDVHLNTQGEKKTRHMENFTRISVVPHGFEINEKRTILVFSKDPTKQKDAIEAGALKTGGTELIKSIQLGELKLRDYEFILADNSIMTDLVPLRGLLKKKFPSTISGTLDDNIVEMVNKFRMGVQYSMEKDAYQKDFGKIETTIGPLNNEATQLEENIAALLKDISAKRPRREGLFITKCFLKVGSFESFRIDPFLYVEKEKAVERRRTSQSVQDEINYDDDSEQNKEENVSN